MKQREIQECMDSGLVRKRIDGRILRLSDNEQHRILRPGWTSEQKTGQFDSHKHRHGRDLEYNFFVRTTGFYELNAPHRSKGRKVVHK